MKTLLLTMFALIGILQGVAAQSAFPDIELVKRLRNFLVEKKFMDPTECEIAYQWPTFSVYNLVFQKDVLRTQDDDSEYGIYSFEGGLVHGPKQVFLKNKDEIVIMQIASWYETIRFEDLLQELIQYFHDRPSLNTYLLPFYVYGLTYVYFENQSMLTRRPTQDVIEEDYRELLSRISRGDTETDLYFD